VSFQSNIALFSFVIKISKSPLDRFLTQSNKMEVISALEIYNYYQQNKNLISNQSHIIKGILNVKFHISFDRIPPEDEIPCQEEVKSLVSKLKHIIHTAKESSAPKFLKKALFWQKGLKF
jgi:hypothetical protein